MSGDEAETLSGGLLEDLRRLAYLKWYQFGWRSPKVLWSRSRIGNWHPVRGVRAFWERGRRGWAQEDVWSFHSYLTRVIREGVHELARDNISHPGGVTAGEWAKILTEIEEGFWAAERMDDWAVGYTDEQRVRDQAEFDLAMEHLHKWWFHLWS